MTIPYTTYLLLCSCVVLSTILLVCSMGIGSLEGYPMAQLGGLRQGWMSVLVGRCVRCILRLPYLLILASVGEKSVGVSGGAV